MTYLDRSNYFRGLLLLVRKSCKVGLEETSMMMGIGKRLGFAYDFCQGALKDVLINEYISDKPPIFSNKGVANDFIKESIELAQIDNYIDMNELEWIGSVIRENEMEEEWRINQLENLYERFEYNSIIGNNWK